MNPKPQPISNEPMLVSYMLLRKMVGSIGLLLPLILMFGGFIYTTQGIQQSISAYYNTTLRDIFVGGLCIVSAFMFCYRGPEPKDVHASNIAGISALGVALFGIDGTGHLAIISESLHYLFATVFFLSLIYFSLVLFVKTSPQNKPTEMKILRNKIYKCCGIAMSIFIGLIAIYFLIPEEMANKIKPYDPVFWLETFSLWAFGISWMVKGEFILKDHTPNFTLGMVALLVDDYDVAIDYYTNSFDFKLQEDTKLNEEKRWVVLSPSGGGCHILLAKASSGEQSQCIGKQGGGRVFLFLYTNHISEYISMIIKKNIQIARPLKEEPYGKVIVIKDLYGNLWDIIEPNEQYNPN